MSTVSYLHTGELRANDTVLDGASTLNIDRIEPDAMADDAYWVYVDCVSGNFENYVRPIRADDDRIWRVIDAIR